MKSQRIFFILLLNFSIIIFPLITTFPFYSYAQDDDFSHPGDEDSPRYIDRVEDMTLTWKIVNASGIFADEDLQPNTLIRYEIKGHNNESYEASVEKKFWGSNEFEKESGRIDDTYYVVRRQWGEIAVEYFLDDHAAYWGQKEDIDQKYHAEYKTEWWEWKLINTVTISFNMNETNYDFNKYTRAEGILLEKKTVVNLYEGEVKGCLHIVLVSYSGYLELSPWFYVIVISLIASLIAVVIVIISLLIQRRKRVYREIEEI